MNGEPHRGPPQQQADPAAAFQQRLQGGAHSIASQWEENNSDVIPGHTSLAAARGCGASYGQGSSYNSRAFLHIPGGSNTVGFRGLSQVFGQSSGLLNRDLLEGQPTGLEMLAARSMVPKPPSALTGTPPPPPPSQSLIVLPKDPPAHPFESYKPGFSQMPLSEAPPAMEAPTAPSPERNNQVCVVDGDPKMPGQIMDVWAYNLEQQIGVIRGLIHEYPYVTLDTEFPGVVAKPVGGEGDSVEDYYYKTVKINVDLMRVIQVGITLTNSRGTSPPGTSTWQFNFRFSMATEIYAQDSISFLQASGINFDVLENHGIDPQIFGELLYQSGLVLNPDIHWITFHGTYDFAYMLQLLRGGPLPETQAEFFALLYRYFPVFYDLKYIVQASRSKELAEHVSLQRLATALGVDRVGKQHQAGSDSLVTALSFFCVMERCFQYEVDDDLYLGILFGLGGWKGAAPPGQLQAMASSVLNASEDDDDDEEELGNAQRLNSGTERLQKAWESTASRDSVTGARFMFGFHPTKI